MIDEKLREVLTNPFDGAIAIVTQGVNEFHVVNSWNSYVNVTSEGKLLIPVGGMLETEKNIGLNKKIQLTIANREVQGKMYKGTGYLIKGTADFLKDGADFDLMKAKFPWARAILAITIESSDQTL